jgi:M6 family metalloprotease-like protein
MKKIMIILSACLMSVAAWAVKASPEPFEYTKADGTKVMARMYGDEFHSYIESLDGELLQGSKDANEMEEAVQMRRAARRIQMGAGSTSYPTTGSPRSLVLLVGFSDLEFDQALQDFRDLLNKSGYSYGGATGSCRDYYIASSDSIFSPQFDCFGPYKLSNTMEYYGGNSGKSHSKNAAQMVAEACQMAHDDGVNFKDYDTNNDGMLDNVFVFYAGHNEAEGGGEKTIWPHQSDISQLNIRLDGVLVTSYACTSEYKGSAGKARCGVGTFCHEFGHVIGQPDFYDTDYNYYSVANWDIMCDGSYNNGGNTPPTFSAYERMYEGWLKPKQLTLPGQYTLTDVPFHKEAYLIADGTHNLSGRNPNPSEFFILDYRSGANGWDAYLPGQGMIVWHIDYSASAWSSNTPNNGPTIMRMHLEEANGITWKKRSQGSKGQASDVYPGTLNVTTFNPTLHNGTQLDQPIFNIKVSGSAINFTYISEGGSSLRSDKESIEVTTTMSDKKKVVDWEPQSFNLFGTGLDPEQPVKLTVSVNTFSLCVSDTMPDMNSSEWKNSIDIYSETDSTLQRQIWVNFMPTKKNCTATKANLQIAATTASITMSLTGNSPRPTYVVTPTLLAPAQITPYSFQANWKKVDDAEAYYITLYQIEEGTTDYVQSFEYFDDPEKVRDAGWQSNTNLITTSAKADGSRALYIKNHGDQVTSEIYPAAITKLSFWYNAFTSSVDTIGVLEMEAYNGEEWVMEDRIVMNNTSKRVTAEYVFEDSQNYRQFRLTWMDNGGSGVAFDAFTATTSQKIIYLHKGRELSIEPQNTKTQTYTISDLNPENTYYYQIQCTDLDKGCKEHLTDLSAPEKVTTQKGKPADSRQLTISYDSINYNPAQHAVYITNPQDGDYLFFYETSGRMVYKVAVKEGVCIYPLELNRFLRGEVYMIQHAVNGSLGRKNKWVKFVF